MRQKLILTLGILAFLASLCFASWDNTKPADSDLWNNAAGFIRDNWDALEVVFGVDLDMDPVTATDIVTKGPWADVKAFGALGDGSTDDSTAIQDTIDFVEAADFVSVVYFPPGKYNFATGLTVATPGSEGFGITLQGAVGAASDFGGDFRADKTTHLHYTGSGVALTIEAHLFRMKDLSLTGTSAADAGIIVGGVSSNKNGAIFENMSIAQFEKVGAYGLAAFSTGYTFRDVAFDSNYDGVKLLGDTNGHALTWVTFYHCHFNKNARYGVNMHATTNVSPARGITFIDCLWQSNEDSGLYAKNDDDSITSHSAIKIIGGWVEDNNRTIAGYQLHFEGKSDSDRMAFVSLDAVILNTGGGSVTGQVWYANTDEFTMTGSVAFFSAVGAVGRGLNNQSVNVQTKIVEANVLGSGMLPRLQFAGRISNTLLVEPVFLIDAHWTYPSTTIAADDVTPDVKDGNVFTTSENNGATVITNFDWNTFFVSALKTDNTGQIITVIGGSDTNASTMASGEFLKLSGAMTLGQYDSITLFFDGSLWIELSRTTWDGN